VIEINPSRFKTESMRHQIDGTKLFVTQKNAYLGDEMGLGKSKQVIDAACILYDAGVIDTMLIACPAQVKISWADDFFGEILKHTWVPSLVSEFTSKRPIFPRESGRLTWVIVSYELGRNEHYSRQLADECKNHKVWIVADEGSNLKNHQALQTKAFVTLRQKYCERAAILNGTPVTQNPLDLYAQYAFLDKEILGAKNYYHFRARHAQMGGYMGKQALRFFDLDIIEKKIRPYTLRRTKDECLDLPMRLGSITSQDGPQVLQVPLSQATWKIYKAMRDEMAVLMSDEASIAKNGMVAQMRLEQICAGYIGGMEAIAPENIDDPGPKLCKEISSEKTDFLIEWLEARREDTSALRVLIWSRFTAEIERLTQRLRAADFFTLQIVGGQRKADRTEAVREFSEGDVTKPCIVVGQPQAGGLGLNLTKCHRVIYLSNDRNLKTRLQSEDRVHRKGQTEPCDYRDIVATGPEGQRTMNYHTLKSLTQKRELAQWTVADWRKVLED
jgi:SNF2 family DNA or RNA helicase